MEKRLIEYGRFLYDIRGGQSGNGAGFSPSDCHSTIAVYLFICHRPLRRVIALTEQRVVRILGSGPYLWPGNWLWSKEHFYRGISFIESFSNM
jgi:hypothetical protein